MNERHSFFLIIANKEYDGICYKNACWYFCPLALHLSTWKLTQSNKGEESKNSSASDIGIVAFKDGVMQPVCCGEEGGKAIEA